MKKLFVLLLGALLLTGCAQEEKFETLTDNVEPPAKKDPMCIAVSLPQEASKDALQGDEAGELYFCDGYTVSVQTLPSGDLEKTLQAVTGHSSQDLQIIKTMQDAAHRYSCVWASTGEKGEQVSRCAILDDGEYHYVLTVQADAQKAGELTYGQWMEIFASFRLMDPQDVVSSGS